MFSALRQASRSGSLALRAHRATSVARVSRPTAFVRTLISEQRHFSTLPAPEGPHTCLQRRSTRRTTKRSCTMTRPRLAPSLSPTTPSPVSETWCTWSCPRRGQRLPRVVSTSHVRGGLVRVTNNPDVCLFRPDWRGGERKSGLRHCEQQLPVLPLSQAAILMRHLQFAPISGSVEEVNVTLNDQPGLLNKSPEEKGKQRVVY